MPSFKKLVQFTVDVDGRLTAAAEDTTPVVKTDGSQAFTANQDMGTKKIVNAADPTGAQDYATKNYVDTHSVSPASNPGALVLLEQHTAANNASLDFTACFTSLYDDYLFEFIDIVPATLATTLGWRASSDGGATFDSGNNYRHAYTFAGSQNTGGTGGSNSESSAEIAGLFSNTASDGVCSGRMAMFDPLSTTKMKRAETAFTFRANDGNHYHIHGSALWVTTASAMNAIQFLMSSGNITSGTIRCYGLAKTAGSGGLAVASATSVYRSTSQTLTHATEAAIAFDTSVFDVDSMWASSPNPSRLTCRQTGKFYVTGQVQFGTGLQGAVHCRLYVNGSTVAARRSNLGQNLASGTESHGVEALLSLTASDYVEFKVELDLQAGSGTFNTVGGAGNTTFSAFSSGGGGGTGDIKSDGSVPFAADESMGGHKITNLATPTLSTDAANKSYVDGLTAPAPVTARIYRSTAQTIPNSVDTALSLDTVDSDSDGFWSAGAPTRLTVPSTDGGGYTVFAQVKWSFSGSGPVAMRLKKNGSTLLAESYSSVTSPDGVSSLSALVELNSGDYIELYLNQQGSAGSENTVGGFAQTYVALAKVGGGGGGSLPSTSAKGDILASTGSEFDVQAVGANKKVLTADSSQPRGVAWNYPGWTLLEEHALTGATVDFTAWQSSDFDEYAIEVIGLIPATSNTTLTMLMSTDGGATFLSSYSYNWRTIVSGTAITGSLAPSLAIGNGLGGLNVNSVINASLKFSQTNGNHPDIWGMLGGFTSGSGRDTCTGGGVSLTTTLVNALRFAMSSGNFSAGTIRIYGVKL